MDAACAHVRAAHPELPVETSQAVAETYADIVATYGGTLGDVIAESVKVDRR
jgi:hypothetical protein